MHVTARDVGGGFGQKMFVFREECAVVLASRLLGQPVKWIEDRRENLLRRRHSRNELGTVRMAVDDDGIIQAHHGRARGRRRRLSARVPAVMDPTLLPGPYKIPRLGFSMAMVWTNTMGKGAYRGPWMFETTAREMAIDHAAREIGIDPAELRRTNLLAAADLPLHLARRATCSQEITPLETLEQALEILDYEAFRKEQAEARAEGRLPRPGLSVVRRADVDGRPHAGHRGRHRAGRVERTRSSRSSAPTSHGQSIETTMAQIVADTSASTTTTSPSCRPTRSRRRTAPAPAAAAPRSSPAARPARPPSRCARR